MCYNSDCHTVRHGALFVASADVSIAYRYWVKHPVLLDYRPADCVTTSASNTGCFVMTVKDGKPCKKCGESSWYESGHCIKCMKVRSKEWQENNREYARAKEREYVSNNRDAVRERKRRWELENRDRINQRKRDYRKENAEHIKQRMRDWRAGNVEKARAYWNKWAVANPEKRRAKDLKWQAANRDKVNAIDHRRRSRQKASGGSYTAAEWSALVNHYGNKCLCCGRDDLPLTVDHVIPIAKGGRSDINNLQPLCKACNSRKKDKTIDYRPDVGNGRWVQEKIFK